MLKIEKSVAILTKLQSYSTFDYMPNWKKYIYRMSSKRFLAALQIRRDNEFVRRTVYDNTS